jgi:spermidine synthase
MVLPLLLALMGGAAAMAHQVLWTRRLVDVLGASAGTFSRVVGAFFVGLALGAWAAARPARDGANFWRRVALAEAGVALLAVPALGSAALADWLGALFALGGWLKLVLPLLLVTPPAFAMGLVTPWMVRALAARPGFTGRHAVWLYALNTLGGVLGIAMVLLDLLPRLGLTGAGLAALAVNALAAAGALALAPRARAADGPLPPRETAAFVPSAEERGLAFVSGFLVLALEVVLQHQLAQVTINSLFSGALVLALVLLALAVAAMLASPLARRLGGERRALGVALLAASLLCALQPFALTGLRGGLNILPYELPPLAYAGEVLKLGLLAVCPVFVAGGLVFPLLLRGAASREGGRRVGLLFAWNGAGGLLGAELAQGWLAPALGLWSSMAVVAAAYAAAALFCERRTISFRPTEGARASGFPGMAGALAAVALLGLALVAGWGSRALPQAQLDPRERLVAAAVGRDGVVATVEAGPDDRRMLFNNSYTLGGSRAQFNQERQGLLPLLLHGRPGSAATLGVATGGSVAGVALLPEVRRIDAIELSPLVLRHAESYFAAHNRGVFGDPRVRFIAEDARTVLAGRRAAYDVVVGDLFLPWRTGEGRLFTREHFQNVRAALKPDGLFCQWLPMFQLTRPQFEAVARTFREVFPEAFLVRGDFYTELPILGLVGGRALTRLDWQRVSALCAELRAAGSVTDPLARHAEGAAMLVIGPLPDPGAGPVNTLANGWLEWDAGRNILGMRAPWFIGVPCAEYARGAHRAGQSLMPPELRAAHDAGQFFLTLEIAAKLNLPSLADLRAQVKARAPRALLEDSRADWRQWPMRVKPVADSADR